MPNVDTEIQDLVELFRKKKSHIEKWFKRVRNELQVALEHSPEQRIHSIRGRLKDEEHLKDKLKRYFAEHKEVPTPADFFAKINDLAGVRVLTLYRNDLAILDYFVNRSSLWRIVEAKANFDHTRYHDREWFSDLGFQEQNTTRRLVANKRGYSSIHYVLAPADMVPEHWHHNQHHKCELQIRTIHEEAWGEFSHEFSYPHDLTDLLATDLIRRLSELLHVAEDMVADIRRTPAVARLFQLAHEITRINGYGDSSASDAIHELISDSYFMNRSAPYAAVALLTRHIRGLDTLEPGTPIEADRVASLGFGKPDDWKRQDELSRLYLDAHRKWVREGTNKQVLKFFVWHDERGGAVPLEPPKLFDDFLNDIEFWFVSQDIHKHIVEAISARLSGCSTTLPSLGSFQFFLWQYDNAREPNPASLPRRKGMQEEPVVGFFAPYKDSDLAAGILWLKDASDPVRRVVDAFATIMVHLRSIDGVLQRMKAEPLRPITKKDLTPQQADAIRSVIDEALDPVLRSLQRTI
jgi:putative GTP pyrophosphokinase